jgi:hypothetical protein
VSISIKGEKGCARWTCRWAARGRRADITSQIPSPRSCPLPSNRKATRVTGGSACTPGQASTTCTFMICWQRSVREEGMFRCCSVTVAVAVARVHIALALPSRNRLVVLKHVMSCAFSPNRWRIEYSINHFLLSLANSRVLYSTPDIEGCERLHSSERHANSCRRCRVEHVIAAGDGTSTF